MKKLLSLLLACVMGSTLLAGCSNTDPSSSSNGQTDKIASQTISIAPVSYTHLDVYKRQAFPWRVTSRLGWSIRNEPNS